MLAENWPQWRGPDLNGISSEKDLPLRWSATENVAWKATLGGVGVSSPIVAGNLVFATSQQLDVGLEARGDALHVRDRFGVVVDVTRRL